MGGGDAHNHHPASAELFCHPLNQIKNSRLAWLIVIQLDHLGGRVQK